MGVMVVAKGLVVEGSRITTNGSYDSNDLGALLASLHGRDSAKSSLNEVLSMIDDIFADFGS